MSSQTFGEIARLVVNFNNRRGERMQNKIKLHAEEVSSLVHDFKFTTQSLVKELNTISVEARAVARNTRKKCRDLVNQATALSSHLDEVLSHLETVEEEDEK